MKLAAAAILTLRKRGYSHSARRRYSDQKDYAMEAARFLKSKIRTASPLARLGQVQELGGACGAA